MAHRRSPWPAVAWCVAGLCVASACTLNTEGGLGQVEGEAGADASPADASVGGHDASAAGSAGNAGHAGSGQGGASGKGGSPAQGGSAGQGGSIAQGGTAGEGGSPEQGGSAGQGGAAEGGAAGQAGASGQGGADAGPVFDPPWWDATFHARWRIEVSNGAASALSQGFQLNLPVQSAKLDSAPAPFHSWRIVRWDPSSSKWTSLPRFIDQRGGFQWIWFRSPAAIAAGEKDSDTFLYFDNSAPPHVSSDPSVFEMFSPFDSSSAAWAQQGTVNYNNGFVVIDGANAGGSIRSANATWGPGHAVDFAMAIVNPVADNSAWLCGGFQRQSDFTDNRPWSLWISRGPARIRPEFYSGTSGDHDGNLFDVDSPNNHIYGIERFRTEQVFLRDFEVVDKLSFATPFDLPMQVRFTALAGSRIRVDFARIRLALNPAPTAALKDLEQGP